MTKNGTEESVIDFIIVSDDLKDEVETIIIDDERKHVLTRVTKTKKGVITVESDHNVMFTHLKLTCNKKVKEKRNEMFNLRNKECQELFKEVTTAANNDHYLSNSNLGNN